MTNQIELAPEEILDDRSAQLEHADKIARITSAGFVVGGVACMTDIFLDYIPDTPKFASIYLGSMLTISGVALYAINKRFNNMRSDETS